MAAKAVRGVGGTWLRLAFGLVTFLLAAAPGCSDDSRPAPAHIGVGGGGGTGGVVSGSCSTEGAVRECHFKVNEHDGFMSCFAGQQECRGGVWSPCAGNVTLSTRPMEGVKLEGTEGMGPSLQPQAYSDAGPSDASTACTVDPCNPYCLGYDEDPPDLTPTFTPSTIAWGNDDEWGNGPSGFVNKQNCGPISPATIPRCDDTYVIPGACDVGQPNCRPCGGAYHYNMFDGCLADHHCNTTTGVCDRNDFTFQWPFATCPGVDFTLGPACKQDLGQGLKQGFLLCNRGNSNVAAGTSIVIRFNAGDAGFFELADCNPIKATASDCTVALPDGLGQGSCLRVVDSAPLATPYEVGPCTNATWGGGNQIAFVNPQDTGLKYPECGIPMANPPTSATMPGCSNNWSDVKQGGNTCGAVLPPGTFSATTVTTDYTASCPPGTKPTWDKLAWDATIACDPGACIGTNESSIVFQAQTAPASAPTAWVPATPVTLATVRSGKPAVCPMSGVAGCPVDIYSLLGGKPNAENMYLKLTIIENPTPNKYSGPTLHSWQISYSCPPAE